MLPLFLSPLPSQVCISTSKSRKRTWPGKTNSWTQAIRLSHPTLSILAVVLVFGLIPQTSIAQMTLQDLREAREDFIDYFRINGVQQPDKASDLIQKITAFERTASDEDRPRALFELGTMQRMLNDFATSIETYERGAQLAEARDQRDVAFDCWIGVARAHALGNKDHGSAPSCAESSDFRRAKPFPETALRNCQLQVTAPCRKRRAGISTDQLA